MKETNGNNVHNNHWRTKIMSDAEVIYVTTTKESIWEEIKLAVACADVPAGFVVTQDDPKQLQVYDECFSEYLDTVVEIASADQDPVILDWTHYHENYEVNYKIVASCTGITIYEPEVLNWDDDSKALNLIVTEDGKIREMPLQAKHEKRLMH